MTDSQVDSFENSLRTPTRPEPVQTEIETQTPNPAEETSVDVVPGGDPEDSMGEVGEEAEEEEKTEDELVEPIMSHEMFESMHPQSPPDLQPKATAGTGDTARDGSERVESTSAESKQVENTGAETTATAGPKQVETTAETETTATAESKQLETTAETKTAATAESKQLGTTAAETTATIAAEKLETKQQTETTSQSAASSVKPEPAIPPLSPIGVSTIDSDEEINDKKEKQKGTFKDLWDFCGCYFSAVSDVILIWTYNYVILCQVFC